jgi:hypothetical protein
MALPFYNVPIIGGFGDLRRDADHALIVRDIGAAGGGTGPGFAFPNTLILAPTGLFTGATSGPASPWSLQKILGTAPTPNTYLQVIYAAAVPAGGEVPDLSLPAYPTVDYEVNYPYGLQFATADTIWLAWSSTPGVYSPGPYGSFRAIISVP